MEGMKDVQRGAVRAGTPGVHGGRDEHTGGVQGFEMHRDTVRKMLRYSVPPGYRRKRPPRRSKLDPYRGVIDRDLEQDRGLGKKQRHTAKRIYERLRTEYGFGGKYTIVKDYVREHRRRTRAMYVPLTHPAGHARAVIGGVEQAIHYFALELAHSDGCFVKAYPAETSEAFWDGHVHDQIDGANVVGCSMDFVLPNGSQPTTNVPMVMVLPTAVRIARTSAPIILTAFGSLVNVVMIDAA